jgi:Glycosyltransferase family 87
MKILLNRLRYGNQTVPRLLTLLMLGVSIVYILHSGLLEFSNSRWFDGRFFYAAGRCWLNGASPYDFETYARYWQEGVGSEAINGFVYPPTLALLAIPLGLFPWNIAKWVLDGINVLALFGIWFFTFQLTIAHPSIRKHSPMPLFCIMLSGWVSLTPIVIHLGQMSLLSVCGILGAFYAQQRQRPILCAAFVLLATFKPQISLLPLVYLLVISSRRFLVPSLSAFAAVLLSIFAFLPPTLAELPGQLLNSYSRYQNRLLQIDLHYASFFGILGETKFAGIATKVGLLLGLFLAVGLALFYRQSFNWQDRNSDPTLESTDTALIVDPKTDVLYHLQILLSAVAALLPVYHYDLVLYVPIVGMLPIINRNFIVPLLVLLMTISRAKNVEAVLGNILGDANSQWFINYFSGLIFLVLITVWLVQMRYTRSIDTST